MTLNTEKKDLMRFLQNSKSKRKDGYYESNQNRRLL